MGDIWAAVSSAVCAAGKSLLLLCWGCPYFGMVCVSDVQTNLFHEFYQIHWKAESRSLINHENGQIHTWDQSTHKLRGEPFLWNRNWDLGWFWAGWQYWKKNLGPIVSNFWGQFLHATNIVASALKSCIKLKVIFFFFKIYSWYLNRLQTHFQLCLTLARANLLCMKNWGTQWTIFLYLKKWIRIKT